MIFKKLEDRDNSIVKDIKKIYNSSFPSEERMPFGMVMQLDDNHEMFLMLEEDELLGFTCIFHNTDDVSFLSYLAIKEERRREGLGSKIIENILDEFKDRRILLDIEWVDESFSNYEERVKRKQFYLSNGFKETEVRYIFRKVHYEILCAHGTVTQADFYNCIYNYWGKIAANITKFF